MHTLTLFGPFAQVLPMTGLPEKGPLSDEALEVFPDAGILVSGNKILEVGPYHQVKIKAMEAGANHFYSDGCFTVIPGIVDAHTHICYAGSRASDYAMRLSGKTYLEIAKQGGGIWSTVQKTREALEAELYQLTLCRARQLFSLGVTTAEVKSGYGLTATDELKMLRVISLVNKNLEMELISTCLAAHTRPTDYAGSSSGYLNEMAANLLPEIKKQGLSHRVDIFIETTAFSPEESLIYLQQASSLGFDIAVHADQFTVGGSEVACRVGAVSADHLEASTDKEIQLLAKSKVVPVALPGASLGLGLPFLPARKLLNAGTSLAIASDWNPGSAPMGDLLTQAAILSAYQHLTITETLAAITVRSAQALRLADRGMLAPGFSADFILFPTGDYRDILYYQGAMKPAVIVKNGKAVFVKNIVPE